MVTAGGVAGEAAQEVVEQVTLRIGMFMPILSGGPAPGKAFVVRRCRGQGWRICAALAFGNISAVSCHWPSCSLRRWTLVRRVC